MCSSRSLLTFCLAKFEGNGDRHWALTVLFHSSQLSALIWEIPTQNPHQSALGGCAQAGCRRRWNHGPGCDIKSRSFPSLCASALAGSCAGRSGSAGAALAGAPLTRSPERHCVTCSSSLVYMETENPVGPRLTDTNHPSGSVQDLLTFLSANPNNTHRRRMVHWHFLHFNLIGKQDISSMWRSKMDVYWSTRRRSIKKAWPAYVRCDRGLLGDVLIAQDLLLKFFWGGLQLLKCVGWLPHCKTLHKQMSYLFFDWLSPQVSPGYFGSIPLSNWDFWGQFFTALLTWKYAKWSLIINLFLWSAWEPIATSLGLRGWLKNAFWKGNRKLVGDYFSLVIILLLNSR